MNIAELKARQMVAMQWSGLAKDMKAKLSLGFGAIVQEVMAVANLDIYCQSNEIKITSSEGGIDIDCVESRHAARRFVVTGLKIDARVWVLRTIISANKGRERPWRVVVLESDPAAETIAKNEFNVLEPCIAMCVDGCLVGRRYLWWRGPGDNMKIAGAVLDAIQNRVQLSDFVLGGRLKGWLHALRKATAGRGTKSTKCSTTR